MKKILIVLGLVFLLAGIASAAEKVIVAAADPWPPFVDPSHPKEGLSLEVIRAAYDTQGYTVKMEYVPWARAEKGVQDGTYDILPDTWMTDKRKAYLEFSEPYAANKVKFIKQKDDPFEYNGIESLTGKVIGTVRGYGYNSDFLNATNFTRDESNDFITNIKKLVLSKKRIDLTLEDEIVGRVLIANEDPNLLNNIRFTENALSTNELYVTCGLINPRHAEIIKAFNKGFETIKSNGTYAKILEVYGIK